jgi:hypothetical protein
MNRSVATLSSPEFINITSVSPFASKCEIKVLYLGENRNRTSIDKATAKEMAQTLPGCPIVGYYSEKEEDFRDHGEQIIMDGDGIKFKCLTVPYGFVAPDAKVWFQDFEDVDEFGNAKVRTYLMTEGYLWTEQYEEAKRVINEGRPQSMELDGESMKGHWSTDSNKGVDFFIINDAIFTKLCILGEDVEPCFEGAAVTSPNVSANFTKNENFSKTLFSMLEELKSLTYSLNDNDKGGKSMPVEENVSAEGITDVETKVVENSTEEKAETEFSKENSDKVEQTSTEEIQDTVEDQFVKKEDEDKKEPEEEKKEDSKEEGKEETDSSKEEEEDKDKKKKYSLEEKFALMEQEFSELKEKYTALEKENEKLTSFKLEVENEKKDALIKQFYMLSDEDMKEVIENKSKYSLDEIESKLAVICYRKKVNFSNEEEKSVEADPALTYNLESDNASSLPAWLQAVENNKAE